MANKKIHHGRTMSRDALAINIVGYLLIGIFGLLCVIPFYLIIVASFTSEASLIRNGFQYTELSALSEKSSFHIEGIRNYDWGYHGRYIDFRIYCHHDGICAFAQGLSVAQPIVLLLFLHYLIQRRSGALVYAVCALFEF